MLSESDASVIKEKSTARKNNKASGQKNTKNNSVENSLDLSNKTASNPRKRTKTDIKAKSSQSEADLPKGEVAYKEQTKYRQKNKKVDKITNISEEKNSISKETDIITSNKEADKITISIRRSKDAETPKSEVFNKEAGDSKVESAAQKEKLQLKLSPKKNLGPLRKPISTTGQLLL